MRRGGAADHDVDVGKLPRPLVEVDRAPAQLGGQSDGAVVRAVRHDEAVRTAGEQGARGFLTGLARADDHDLPFVQRIKNFLRQFHGHGGDGDTAALDVGLGADLLGHLEGALESLVQPRAGVPVLEGQVVGFLELAEDFGFAEHHRVETAGDLEQVLNAVGIGNLVKLVAERAVVVVNPHQKSPEFGKSPARFE